MEPLNIDNRKYNTIFELLDILNKLDGSGKHQHTMSQVWLVDLYGDISDLVEDMEEQISKLEEAYKKTYG